MAGGTWTGLALPMDVTIHLGPDVLRRVDSFAAERGCSRAAAVEAIFQEGLRASTSSPSGVGSSKALHTVLQRIRESKADTPPCLECGAPSQRWGSDYWCPKCWDESRLSKPEQHDFDGPNDPFSKPGDSWGAGLESQSSLEKRVCRHCGGSRFGQHGFDIICLDCRDNEGQEDRR